MWCVGGMRVRACGYSAAHHLQAQIAGKHSHEVLVIQHNPQKLDLLADMQGCRTTQRRWWLSPVTAPTTLRRCGLLTLALP